MSTQHLVVTLDGPAGVGKTTLAKWVANKLGVAYLDTGAMFRTIALMLGPGGWNLDENAIRIRLSKLAFSLSGSGADTILHVNDTPVGDEIRTEEVGMWASNIATLPVVRAFLKQAQQDVGAGASLVAEGRDMGTVVFPGADYKFFLDATPEERARRRQLQLQELGKDVPALEALTEQLKARDEQDRNRAVAPLRPAEDGIIVDTTHLDIKGVFDELMRHVQSGDESPVA